MEVALLNKLSFHSRCTPPCTAGDILVELREVYKIKERHLFCLFNNQEVLEDGSVILKNEGLKALPVHLSDFGNSSAQNEFVLQQVFEYCFQMYQESRWPCADIQLVQLSRLLYEINSATPIVSHLSMLLPERQRALADYYLERCKQIDIKADDCLMLEFINCLRESAYFGFVQFPVLDVEQDWTSLLGISHDGIVLIDAEIGTAYLYFQHDYYSLRTYGEEQLQFTVHPALSKIRSQEYFEPVKPQQADQRVPKIMDFIANTTKSIELPLFSKLPNEEHEGVERGERLREFKVQQTEKFIARINQGPEAAEGGVFHKLEIIPVRQQFTLTFANSCICQSVLEYLEKKQTMFDPSGCEPRRSLRVMSGSTLELFKQIYMNNCVKYCVRPLRSLIERVDQCLDSGHPQIFNDLTIMREKITHMHVRSIVQATIATLDFDPIVGSFRVDSTCDGDGNTVIITRRLNPTRITRLRDGSTRFFRGGAGTPYDPFVPIHFGIERNFAVQRAAFISSDFTNLAWVQEIAALLQHQVVSRQLRAFEVSDNLLMNKGAIILAARCADLESLRALHLSNCKIKQTGLSCLLYLLDSANVYLEELSLEGVKCHTKAAFQQLGIYIGRCWKRYGVFERLDISGCEISLEEAQGFTAGCLEGSSSVARGNGAEEATDEGLLRTESGEADTEIPARAQTPPKEPPHALTQGGEADKESCNTASEHHDLRATSSLKEETSEPVASLKLGVSTAENEIRMAALTQTLPKEFVIEVLVCKRCFQADALAQENMQQLCRSFITE